MDDFNNPFDKLKGLKLKKEKPEAPAKAPKPKPAPAPAPKPGKKFGAKPGQTGKPGHATRQAPPAEDLASQEPAGDSDLFARAMSGVNRMDKTPSGRQVAARAAPPPPPKAADPDAEARAALRDLVAGKVEFELEYTDEYVQGFVKGTDSKIFRQLKAGAYSPEAHLDLHGLNSDQAYESLLLFTRDKYYQGKRCLLLIPGRGINSPGGMPVLKEELKSWLTRDPLKRVVLAFCTAQPRHGGAGALYVLLRQRRKTEGKIKWDNLWGDD